MRLCHCWVVLAALGTTMLGEEHKFAVNQRPGRVAITRGRQAVATYIYQDKKILRPYFAHLHAPGGTRVTRNHPPIQGKDPTDHATMHPGLWLAFGDISGHDFWRNRAVVKHDRFVDPPAVRDGAVSFTVRNRYLAKGGKFVCEETCRYALRTRPGGYLLIWDSTFKSDAGDFVFGDQEEMGLGVRVATPISVRKGGRIAASHGGRDERGTWGKAAKWCDYSGLVGGRHVGVAIMPDPVNFRPCWFHSRDYGVMVANPFGRQAMRRGPKSAVRVAKGKSLRLRFGVLLHASQAGKKTDIQAAYEDFLRRLPARGGEAGRAQRPVSRRPEIDDASTLKEIAKEIAKAPPPAPLWPGPKKGQRGSADWANARVRFIRLKYRGGDWDQDMGLGADYNLLRKLRDRTGFNIAANTEAIEISALRRFPKRRGPPFVYITGQGDIRLAGTEIQTLRWYCLEARGMLFADNGGGRFDRSFRGLCGKVFPDKPLKEIPDDDPIFRGPYVFPHGAPPLWRHSGNRALGIGHEGRWVVFYHQGDLNDAWKTGHSGASKQMADRAYKMGINVMFYAFRQYLGTRQPAKSRRVESRPAKTEQRPDNLHLEDLE